jgi:hypothetical protein
VLHIVDSRKGETKVMHCWCRLTLERFERGVPQRGSSSTNAFPPHATTVTSPFALLRSTFSPPRHTTAVISPFALCVVRWSVSFFKFMRKVTWVGDHSFFLQFSNIENWRTFSKTFIKISRIYLFIILFHFFFIFLLKKATKFVNKKSLLDYHPQSQIQPC